MLQHLAGELIPNLLQAHAGGIDAEQPGDDCAKQRRPDEDVKKRLGADIDQQNWEQKSRRDSADLCEGCGEACAHAANARRKNLAGEEVGLRIRSKVRHEVEQHESGEDEKELVAAGHVSGSGGDRQTRGAADEAQDLQPDAAGLVHEKNGADDTDDQQKVDEPRALGRQDVVVDEVGKVSRVSRFMAERNVSTTLRQPAFEFKLGFSAFGLAG